MHNRLCHLLFLLGAATILLPLPLVAQTASHEILRLRIVNDVGGEISASRDQGLSWQTVGRVVRYTTQVSRKGYTASKWVAPGHVAATAVNAIHINVGYNNEDDRGVVFSILPRELLTTPATYSSFLSPDSSIYTNIPAGQGIFGGGGAPLVGNTVYLGAPSGIAPLRDGYVPARGDVLVVVVDRPARYPIAAEFENRPGGAVTLMYADGSRELLGWVVKPVGGIGRFLGGIYTGIGRIRADHAGVVDITTSPIGALGGFQIIPFGHAISPEMGNAWRLTQWMIVGPLKEGSSLWDGITPLFCGYIRPDYLSNDLYAADWRVRLLSRFVADADLGHGWQPVSSPRLSSDPNAALPAWAGSALSNVKRLRILFPLAERSSVEVVQQP
ncbi:MAG: hypothetical protein ABSD48_04925 [Armatimonadota bacterium]|jgi:hypothetical protein